jgi:DNA-binding IclR family transcriptional regulator
MAKAAPSGRDYTVPALARGIEILEALAAEGRPMAAAALADRLGLPRSSVFRLIYTLAQKGLIEVDAQRRSCTLGAGVLRLGYSFLVGQDLTQVARPALIQLAERTQVSAHLAIRSERDLVYLLHIPGPAGFVSNVPAGTRLPAHATPMGQLLLSGLPRAALAELYDGHPLTALTAQTPTTLAALEAAIARAAARGHVVSRGSMEAGGISICAPVADASGTLVAAIDISCPETAFDSSALETRYVPEVLAAAQAITQRLAPR